MEIQFLVHLTECEKQLLKAIRYSNYGNGAETLVWSTYNLLEVKYPASIHSGVMSSLVKKGLAETHDHDQDRTVQLTKLGASLV